ncbi:MAG: MmcQ/YjbR family DNA-binding protein [Alphaproteobacteria bacterium]|nr:MmcQ/YjbR family DNA-binding protein [Alphaproteobacteria bacterium]
MIIETGALDMPVRLAAIETRAGRIRQLCLDQPRGLERIMYGFPVFSIGKGKVFVWLLHGLTIDRSAIAVRISGADEREMLIEADSAIFFRPRYLGRWNWIGMRFDLPSITWSQLEARIRTSWILSATPAQLRKYCMAPERTSGFYNSDY